MPAWRVWLSHVGADVKRTHLGRAQADTVLERVKSEKRRRKRRNMCTHDETGQVNKDYDGLCIKWLDKVKAQRSVTA